MIEIVHRYTRNVLYRSKDVQTHREAVEDAYLADANLADANLAGVDLVGAYLARANLVNADLADANLAGTVLDPSLPTNKHGDFREIDGECVGYRTRRSNHCGDTVYEDGKTYKAEVFSVCPLTSCHPGLYIYSTAERAREEYEGTSIIEVRFKRDDLHQAGPEGYVKHRVRAFRVIGEVKDR